MSDTTQAPAEPDRPARPKREILGPTGLIVMVAAILLFTAVSIIIEVASNSGTSYRATVTIGEPIRSDAVKVVFHVTNTGAKPGRPDVCEASLFDLRGARVGSAGVYLDEPIQPGETVNLEAVGTVASRPTNGAVRCRALEPG